MKRWPLVLLLLAGCAYYNGMYNTNRLARSAEKAERDGRTFEAQNLWAQAAVRAESVLVQHPTSKWADDAALIKGKALSRRGDCRGAVGALERAARTSDDPAVAEEARFLLGQCWVTLGELGEADRVFVNLLDSDNPTIRLRARLEHAQSLRRDGRWEEALAALAGTSGRAAEEELAVVWAGEGNLVAAESLAVPYRARADTTFPWELYLDQVGRHRPELASALTDSLLTWPGPDQEQRARWLLADGRRLLSSDTSRAIARLRASGAEGGVPTAAGGEALLLLHEHELAVLTDPAGLAPLQARLDSVARRGGRASVEAFRLSVATADVVRLLDSVVAGQPGQELDLFLAAEMARDSLGAPDLASELLHRLLVQWPASPYGAKALLALAALRPDSAVTFTDRLAREYPTSPYFAYLQEGEPSPALTALEEALRHRAETLLGTVRLVPSARPRATKGRGDPEDIN